MMPMDRLLAVLLVDVIVYTTSISELTRDDCRPSNPKQEVSRLDWRKGLRFVSQLVMCAIALVGLGISLIAQNARPVAFDVASVKPNRSAWLLGVFAISALLLASIGVYGLIAYAARQREPEIAIRMALGADGRAMRNLLLRSGAVLTGVGLAIGIVASWAGARVMTAFLYGVSPRDPVAFVVAPAILALVTLAAIWRPASRVARISPAQLLRME
jgi:hypothetical protein